MKCIIKGNKKVGRKRQPSSNSKKLNESLNGDEMPISKRLRSKNQQQINLC